MKCISVWQRIPFWPHSGVSRLCRLLTRQLGAALASLRREDRNTGERCVGPETVPRWAALEEAPLGEGRRLGGAQWPGRSTAPWTASLARTTFRPAVGEARARVPVTCLAGQRTSRRRGASEVVRGSVMPRRPADGVERVVERVAAKSQCNQCFRCGPSCYLCRSSHESRRAGLS